MLTLIVPGLIWTRQALADLTYDLPLPAFTTLLIFLPAMFAVALGRWLVDRRRPPYHRQRGGAGGDVFSAVGDEDPNEKYAVSRTELDWRQDAREAVRLEHEEADLRLHDHLRE